MHSLSRRAFLKGAGAFVLSQVVLPRILAGRELPQDLKPLRLGFLTDCHAMAERGAPESLNRAAELMNGLQPELLIGGGDFVHGGFGTWTGTMDSRWKIADRFLRKLDCRMEPMIGNHDFYNPVARNGGINPGNPRRRFLQQFGLKRTYRSFVFKGYKFLLLDPIRVIGGSEMYDGWVSSEQLAWLETELATTPPSQPLVVCSHIPLKSGISSFLEGALRGASSRTSVSNASEVISRLEGRPVILVLQGHVHLNERLSLGGIPCITGGAVCGKWWRGSNLGTNPGLGLIEINPGSSPDWNYHDTPTA